MKEDKKIFNELERLNMDDNFRFEYDAELRQKKMVNSARAEGITEGIEQERTKIVLKLESLNYKIADIANIVGISVEEVENIIKSQ